MGTEPAYPARTIYHDQRSVEVGGEGGVSVVVERAGDLEGPVCETDNPGMASSAKNSTPVAS
jgi:hypothetical protein